MTIDKHVRKAAILEDVRKKAKRAGYNEHETAIGQMVALRHYDENDHASAHRAIQAGMAEAKRLHKKAAKDALMEYMAGHFAH